MSIQEIKSRGKKHDEKIGGIIVAASKRKSFPMSKVGSIPVIKRIAMVFQKIGISPIVIVTGHEEVEIKHELVEFCPIFLKDENYEVHSLFESARIGFEYIQDKCDRVIFTPVNTPMFSPKTLEALLSVDASIVTPSYNGRGGHPIILKSEVIPTVLAFEEHQGLRSILASLDKERVRVNVSDEGILENVRDGQILKEKVKKHNEEILRPSIKVSLAKEKIFFNTRVKVLILLIGETKSVRKACDRMGLSYGKAWDMLNELEEALGCSIVTRKHGGKKGGRTELTQEGVRFLSTYETYENQVLKYSQQLFNQLFVDDLYKIASSSEEELATEDRNR